MFSIFKVYKPESFPNQAYAAVLLKGGAGALTGLSILHQLVRACVETALLLCRFPAPPRPTATFTALSNGSIGQQVATPMSMVDKLPTWTSRVGPCNAGAGRIVAIIAYSGVSVGK